MSKEPTKRQIKSINEFIEVIDPNSIHSLMGDKSLEEWMECLEGLCRVHLIIDFDLTYDEASDKVRNYFVEHEDVLQELYYLDMM